jgi:hypothetical protein
MTIFLENDEATKESVRVFGPLVQIAIYTAPFYEVNTLLSDATFKSNRLLHRPEDAKKA